MRMCQLVSSSCVCADVCQSAEDMYQTQSRGAHGVRVNCPVFFAKLGFSLLSGHYRQCRPRQICLAPLSRRGLPPGSFLSTPGLSCAWVWLQIKVLKNQCQNKNSLLEAAFPERSNINLGVGDVGGCAPQASGQTVNGRASFYCRIESRRAGHQPVVGSNVQLQEADILEVCSHQPLGLGVIFLSLCDILVLFCLPLRVCWIVS
jgi:hypothetical protein